LDTDQRIRDLHTHAPELTHPRERVSAAGSPHGLQFGRAPEQVEDAILPTDADGIAALSWQQMQKLAATRSRRPQKAAMGA
jgi:hypothetical protein